MNFEQANSIGILGDEDTINGFMISGALYNPKVPNFLQSDYNTPEEDLVKMFKSLVVRKDLAIILICDFVYEKIQKEIDKHKSNIPAIIEIPSKIKSMNKNG